MASSYPRFCALKQGTKLIWFTLHKARQHTSNYSRKLQFFTAPTTQTRGSPKGQKQSLNLVFGLNLAPESCPLGFPPKPENFLWFPLPSSSRQQAIRAGKILQNFPLASEGKTEQTLRLVKKNFGFSHPPFFLSLSRLSWRKMGRIWLLF